MPLGVRIGAIMPALCSDVAIMPTQFFGCDYAEIMPGIRGWTQGRILPQPRRRRDEDPSQRTRDGGGGAHHMDAANATHREPRGARPGSPARPENAPFSRRSCGAFSRRSAHSPTEEIGAVRPGERTILPEIGTSAQRNLAALATTIHRTLLLTTAQYTWARQGT